MTDASDRAREIAKLAAYNAIPADVTADPAVGERIADSVSTAILAALSAAGLQFDEGWMPIETAPKDGTMIMLCVGDAQAAIGCWFNPPDGAHEWRYTKCWVSFDPEGLFESDEALDGYLENTRYDPTHFRPLPPPPKPGD